MTMHTVYVKQDEGISQNAIGSLPWSQPIGESFGQFMSHPFGGDQLVSPKEAEHGTVEGQGNGITAQFTLFSGNFKSPANGPKVLQLQGATSVPIECRSHFELGFGQPVICSKYPYGDRCYGVFSTYGPQITGRIMLPLNLTADDGPIFVNPKQYHGIIRRRRSRAKAESEKKVQRGRKPYLHESRHRHAMRRPRGSGGRFLNTKNPNGGKGGNGTKKSGKQFFHRSGSQNSEVLQSDSGNSNSTKEANSIAPNLSASEVTSVFFRGDLNCFPVNHLCSSVLSLSDMMASGQGIVMPSQWVAAADSHCNLKV